MFTGFVVVVVVVVAVVLVLVLVLVLVVVVLVVGLVVVHSLLRTILPFGGIKQSLLEIFPFVR